MATTKKKRVVPRKFIQLISDSSLKALDNKGDVWIYQGVKYGWAKLNMHKMSDIEVECMWEEKHA